MFYLLEEKRVYRKKQKSYKHSITPRIKPLEKGTKKEIVKR